VLIKTVKDFASLKMQLKDTDNCCFHQTDLKSSISRRMVYLPTYHFLKERIIHNNELLSILKIMIFNSAMV
jgi:hypothetical protein